MKFAAALTDHRQPVPSGLSKPYRFRVYRNNVVSALIAALGVRYPAAQRLVGEAFFAEMAECYALKTLPKSPVLIEYGGDFPDFIARFAPASPVPYLADMARLESAWWRAYHAADEAAPEPDAFAAIPADRVGEARFSFHPSTALLSSPFAVASIWRSQRGDGDLSHIQINIGGTALVSRPHSEVIVTVLEEADAAFLSALMAGAPLAEAAVMPGGAFDLSAALRQLIASRIVTAIALKDVA